MIEAEVTSTGVPFKLDEPIALAFFRIAQEALRNAGKYSGARLVRVELAWKVPELSMAITDDGAGFDPGTASGSGLGLISMRERMRLVGGDLSVTSAKGQGTRIEARVRLVSTPMAVAREEAPLHAERRKRARA